MSVKNRPVDKGEEYMRELRSRALGLIAWVDRLCELGTLGGDVIMEIKVQTPHWTGGDYRVMVKGVSGDGSRVIAFANGSSFSEALQAARAKAEGQGLAWREDKPYPNRG